MVQEVPLVPETLTAEGAGPSTFCVRLAVLLQVLLLVQRLQPEQSSYQDGYCLKPATPYRKIAKVFNRTSTES